MNATILPFPRHEIVERLPGLSHRKGDYGCVIQKAKKRGLVRNQIEWVDQIIKSSN